MNKVIKFQTQKVVGQIAYNTNLSANGIQVESPEDIYNFKVGQIIHVSENNNPYLDHHIGHVTISRVDEEKQNIHINEGLWNTYIPNIKAGHYLIDLEYEEKVSGPEHLKTLRLEKMVFERDKNIKSLLYILKNNDLLDADIFSKYDLNKDLQDSYDTIHEQGRKYAILQKQYEQCVLELEAIRESCQPQNSPMQCVMKFLYSKIPFVKNI